MDVLGREGKHPSATAQPHTKHTIYLQTNQETMQQMLQKQGKIQNCSISCTTPSSINEKCLSILNVPLDVTQKPLVKELFQIMLQAYRQPILDI